jgi:hypothetical protein
VNNLERLEQPKNDLEEVVTFHNGEQKQLEDIIENIEPETVQRIKNHPLELQRMKIELKTPQELMWDLIEKTFWYHETIATSPHARESEIDQL